MNRAERLARYDFTHGLSAAQVRRVNHKDGSRKTHEHEIDENGKRVRCLRCRPLPWDASRAVRPEDGPRDWMPGQHARLHQRAVR